MPVLKVQTNKSIENKESWMKEATSFIADMLSKPEKYIMVHVEENKSMLFSASDDPLAYIELKSIHLPEEETKGFSASLCDFIEQTTQIPKSRIYIEFSNVQRHMFGWNGATFER